MSESGYSEFSPTLIQETAKEEIKNLSESRLKFLAGMFEVGGGMTIQIHNAKKKNSKGEVRPYQHTSPIIYINDNDEEKMREMVNIYGGNCKKAGKKNSWGWNLYGRQATALLRQIKNYAPSRQEEISAFEAHQNALDMGEKITIARALNAYNHKPISFPDPSEYAELVEDPNFVAGIYEARGALQVNPLIGSEILIVSENISILEALRQRFEGTVRVDSNMSNHPERIIKGTTPSFHYALTGENKTNFIETISPYVLHDSFVPKNQQSNLQ